MLDAVLRRQLVEGAAVAPADELLAAPALDERVVGEDVDGDPVAVLAAAVVGVGLDRRGDVRRQRPRRRRPDDERLALALEQREAHEERRVLELDVVLLARLLVLRQRRAAARAPLRRAVPLVQPAAAVHLLEEHPDVLDVRVGERVVVVVPVHPLAEPLRLLGLHLGEARDALLAPLGELGEPVLLDLALRVEAELLLDLDLDPEPLAVEAVLVALVVAAERLVALEDVLETRPRCCTPAGPFAVIGPSMKLNVGPPRLRSRSLKNVPSSSQSARMSCSSAAWSGTAGSGVKRVSRRMLSILESGNNRPFDRV